MQPQFVKVPVSVQTSFIIRDMIVPYFYNPYHFHPELELTYITQGTGTRYIGDCIESFSEGDLILVGANLPHLWKNDEIYYTGDPYLKARALVIQFREDLYGEHIWQLPEMRKIKSMLHLSQQGLKIQNRSRKEIVRLMQAMLDQSEAERIINLLTLMNIIAESKDIQTLSSKNFSVNALNVNTGLERINAVFAYIFENFSKEISLNDVANIINMSPTAFCRYFKDHTHRTFSSFLIETRIHHSCKLILNEDLSLSEIAFKSGFNSLSYFTKQFKKILSCTPTHYRKKFSS